MDTDEVKEALKNFASLDPDFANPWNGWYEPPLNEEYDLGFNHKVSKVEEAYAREGDFSAEVHMVFKVTETGYRQTERYFMIRGRYESFDGTNWEEHTFHEVSLQPVTQTRYMPV